MLCNRCGRPADFSDRYDAEYCARCDLWLEDGCADPKCWAQCGQRPSHPSQAKHQFNPGEHPPTTPDPTHFLSRIVRLAYPPPR